MIKRGMDTTRVKINYIIIVKDNKVKKIVRNAALKAKVVKIANSLTNMNMKVYRKVRTVTLYWSKKVS